MNWTDPIFLTSMGGLAVGIVVAIVVAVQTKNAAPVIAEVVKDIPTVIEAVEAEEKK
jgi:hypothetical protein